MSRKRLHKVARFLAEYPNDELCLFIHVKGRRDDAVAARGQTVSAADLAGIDVGGGRRDRA